MLTVVLTATVAVAHAGDCPPAPDISPETGPLLQALRYAPSPDVARVISDRLWGLWTIAPDAQAQAYLDRGMGRRAAYDYQGAAEALDALVTYCPEFAEGYNQRAFVRFLNGDYEAALEDLEMALTITPDHIGAMSGMALTLMGLGQMDRAQAVLLEALELNPWLPERRYLIKKPKKPRN